MTQYEQYIQEELQELGIEAELIDIDQHHPSEPGQEPEFGTRQITKIVPYQPGESTRKNEDRTYVTPDGKQFIITVKERPQCPSCDYVLAGEDERRHPSRCSEDNCSQWTCPQCETICDACDNTLCNYHSYGHGVKDGAYCHEDYLDVDEQVEHERQLEKNDQKHQQKVELFEQRRQTIKDQKEQKRQDLKLESEIKQKKAETAIRIVQQLQQQQDNSGYPELPEEVQRIQQLTQND